jgi:hypothetical protein
LDLAVFEHATPSYEWQKYEWSIKTDKGYKNLWGVDGSEHCFTWQFSGGQFRIIETIFVERLVIHIQPPKLSTLRGRKAYLRAALKAAKLGKSWVQSDWVQPP